MREILYNIKKNIKKIWKMYFTTEGTYTCILPDKIYLKMLYKKRMGKKLELNNPKTFTEKLNWLKLYDRKNEYTNLVDKYKVREHISNVIGEEYLVPLVGVWDSVDEIEFDKLPTKFVIKCNHDNGVIICKDKCQIDFQNVKCEIQKHLNRDWYKKAREWPYKNVKRKIICEKFMENTNGEELVDYKVWCFNGNPKFIMLNSDRFDSDGIKVDMYDLEWNHMDMNDGEYPQAGDRFEKPNCLSELIEISKKLSAGIPFARVDFNCWNHKLYFGEITFYHSAGLETFRPIKWDEILGDWLKI